MNLSHIRQEAASRLQEDGGGFRKLVLIHTAVTAGVSLLLMLVSWSTQYIAPEGGLSNMGTQDLLSTCQILLQLICMIAIPFWDAGLIYCALGLTRNIHTGADGLTEGFRRWSPIASSLGIRGVIYFAVSTVCSFASSLLLSYLPLPQSIIQELTEFAEAPVFPLSSGVQMVMIVYILVYCINLCVLLIPRLYLHRQVVYRIMDDRSCGGLQAVLHSRMLMKGQRLKLLRMDLSFWWFYLLELVISGISVAHLLLPELGIQLPMSDELAAWVFPIAALLGQLGLYYLAKPKLVVSYALFYQSVLEESQKEPEPPKPKRMPWSY